MSDRLTAAGEALLTALHLLGFTHPDNVDRIRAIEAEAAARAVDEALSVERVAEALLAIAGDLEAWLHYHDGDAAYCAAALVAHLRGPR